MLDIRNVYHLQQQTPLIHFQHDEPGACLRASEVKPKLDRFLLEQLGQGDRDEGQRIAKSRGWLIGDHPALDYKMRFEAVKPEEREPQEPKPRGLFFGNVGKSEAESYMAVLYGSGIDMTIICFHDDLKQTIESHLHAFFLIHNFGTRQSKGFGSFVVTAKDKQLFLCKDVQAELLKHSKIYGYDLYAVKRSGGLNAVLELYQRLKSGRPGCAPYIHTKIEKHEKDWMRAQGFFSQVRVTPLRKEESEKYHFYKAMLGLRDAIDYPQLKQTIKIEHAEKDKDGKPIIQRAKSPITFKIVDSGRFFLLVHEAPDALFGQVFRFYDTENPSKKYRITTPTEDAFSVKILVRDFMQQEYPNSEVKEVLTP